MTTTPGDGGRLHYRKCPKCGHERSEHDSGSLETCPACRLVYRKYLQSLGGAPGRGRADAGRRKARAEPGTASRWLAVPEEADPWRFRANAALLALAVFFGWRYYFMDLADWEMAGTFLHVAMTPFHEFGHLLFRPFGEFMTLLGGSLTQILMPLAFGALFALKNRDNFAASLMLWWSGTQFLDVAPYVYDAKQPQHVLLTGRTGDTGGHDFIDVLGDLGLLDRAHQVAWGVHTFGLLVMLAAWAWAAALLLRQHRARRSG